MIVRVFEVMVVMMSCGELRVIGLVCVFFLVFFGVFVVFEVEGVFWFFCSCYVIVLMSIDVKMVIRYVV